MKPQLMPYMYPLSNQVLRPPLSHTLTGVRTTGKNCTCGTTTGFGIVQTKRLSSRTTGMNTTLREVQLHILSEFEVYEVVLQMKQKGNTMGNKTL